MTNKQLIQFITEQYKIHADEEYAVKMGAYMKGHFDFYGARGDAKREILKLTKLAAKDQSIDDLLAIAIECYSLPQREYQNISADLLKWKKKQLKTEHLEGLEQLLVTKSWWDTVDNIASNLVGEILSKDKSLQYKWAEKWIASDNMWLRRTAIIHQLRYKASVDKELLFVLIESQKESKEFFIRKACGWALRQYSRFNPVAVINFVDLHPDLSGLTKREALRLL